MSITLALDETGYRLASGHRLRLALSTAYWPLILPSPAPVTAILRAGAEAELTLPVLTGAAEAPPPVPSDASPLPDYPALTEGCSRRHVEHDRQTGRVRYMVSQDGGWTENPVHGMRKRESREEVWEIDPADPADATGHLVFEAERARECKSGEWRTTTRAEIHFTCAATEYRAEASLTAHEGDEKVFEKTWSFAVPRDHM